jgi:hypothetical protein
LSEAKRDGLGILGLGAVACAACCVGPIVAFFGGLGVVGIAGTMLFGAAGIGIVAIAAAALHAVRRRRAGRACPPNRAEPVTVGPPTRRVKEQRSWT